jgi:hypothetical protein
MVLSASYDARGIREAVREAYSAASKDPRGEHAFPVGKEFAQSLGYPSNLLAQLPAASVEAFSGVSNVSVMAEIPAGACVLDLGCGAGVDSLIAAKRSGPGGGSWASTSARRCLSGRMGLRPRLVWAT